MANSGKSTRKVRASQDVAARVLPRPTALGIDKRRLYHFDDFCQELSLSEIVRSCLLRCLQESGQSERFIDLNIQQRFVEGLHGWKHLALIKDAVAKRNEEASKRTNERRKRRKGKRR